MGKTITLSNLRSAMCTAKNQGRVSRTSEKEFIVSTQEKQRLMAIVRQCKTEFVSGLLSLIPSVPLFIGQQMASG